MEKGNNKRRKPSLELDSMMFGKVPPQARELEAAILGAIMLEKNAMNEVSQLLRPEHFYGEANQRIFKAFKSLERKHAPIDLLTVVEELKTKEELDLVGGPHYITTLTNGVVSSANIIAHAYIVIQKFIKRELIRIGGETVGNAYNDDTDALEILNEANNTFFKINYEIENTKTVSLPDMAMKYIERRENRNADTSSLIFTGFEEWDRINGPLFRGGVYVVAGRPGMGKTAFVVELIKRMAATQQVGFINLEMSNDQIVQRFASNMESIDNGLLKRTDDEDWLKKKIYRGVEQFVNLKLDIESKKGLTIDAIISKLKYWKFKNKMSVAVIDYLQMIRVSEERQRYNTKTENTEYILDMLFVAAAELDIPLFLLCQLNRELYKRGGNKEPEPSDLKDAGKIEEIAYQISFLHRPEFYGMMVDENGETTEGLAYQIIKKHRDGELARIKYTFEGKFSKFTEYKIEKYEAPDTFGDDVPF